MIIISKKEWERKSKDYKGAWTKDSYPIVKKELPESYIGKRTCLYNDGKKGTCLITEGVHFNII